MLELPGYNIIRELGQGGMARVYLALHKGLDREVAIKVMFKNLAADAKSKFSDRFIREARIVAKLSHHNIITVFDVGVHDDNYYIAMEFLPGETLGDKIKSRIKPGLALTVMKQVSAGLKYAHDKGFIHRDIKPENILFREDGTAVISDFGIARAEKSDTKMTQEGTVIGTAHYMSPEQAMGKKIAPTADLYSLGIVLYEMLNGKVPYDADTSIAIVFKHIKEPLPELKKKHKKYQPLLHKLLAKNPKDRYQSGSEIISDIEDIERGQKPTRATQFMARRGTEALSGTKLMDRQGSQGLWKWVTAVAAILVIVSGAGAYYYVYLPQQEQLLAEQKKNEAETSRQAKAKEADIRKQDKKQQRIEAENNAAAKKQKDAILAKQREKDRKKSAERAATREQERKLASERSRKEKQKQARIKQQRDDKIRSLLSKAESSLLKTRLRDAYNHFKDVLKTDSRNKSARNGMQRVADRYLSLASTEAIKGDFKKADSFVASAIQIAPTNKNLASTQKTIFELRNKRLQEQAEQQRIAQQEAERQRKVNATQTAPQQEQPKKRRTFGGF